MLKQRLIVAFILLPIGLAAVFMGGLYFTLLITIFLVLAAWEYTRLMNLCGAKPATWLVVGGTLSIIATRHLLQFKYADLLLSVIILLAMTHHLVSYERGRDQAATDFTSTLGGILYIGWIGSYLISLRLMDGGLWWFLVALPATWLADVGAFFIGSAFGRHPMSRRVSPKKTWEGYFGGIVVSVAGTIGLAALWRIWGSSIPTGQAAIIALVMSALTTLGDLSESVFKRQAGVKDSGSLLPGHGGFFDRVDSWLWAGVVAYYLVSLCWV